MSIVDWSTDYDIFDTAYVTEPYPVWDELRRTCPIAHSDRYGASWLPTRYDDVAEIARDVEHFSSRSVAVVAPPEDETVALPLGLPPISSDPPVHTWSRRLLLPWFSHDRVAQYEPLTRDLCRRLAADIAERGHGDAAVEYAQQIPARVIAGVLGVPPELSDTFTGWVRDLRHAVRS